jgi:BirA family biotin operon repressor/biotin-[acetyl-CoA-carboxylase] ligase
MIQRSLKTSIVAREVYAFSTIDSTNRIAKEYAVAGVSDGTLIVAEKQTRGKGRMNRVWFSPARENILCSIIFFPSTGMSEVFRFTMLASIAVVRAIDQVCCIKAQIKWPNDVYINGRKVCGILTEFSADHDKVQYVVIGIGINVNFDASSHSETSGIATSLKEETGIQVSRIDVLRTFLEEIDAGYQKFLDSDKLKFDLKKEWMRHSMVLNKQVKIISENDIICGLAKGINDEGHLILEDSHGEIKEISSGDLSLRLEC